MKGPTGVSPVTARFFSFQKSDRKKVKCQIYLAGVEKLKVVLGEREKPSQEIGAERQVKVMRMWQSEVKEPNPRDIPTR